MISERKSITGRKKDYWDYFCTCIESVKGVNDGIKYVKTVGDVRCLYFYLPFFAAPAQPWAA